MNYITLNPLRIFSDIWRHRYLLSQLIKRDVLLRYRGAIFGILWMFLSPLAMLVIYAFIFGKIFQVRWPQTESGIPFWLLLYSGLIAFNIFSETILRSSASVRSHPNFVKKIIFPVSILPIVPLGAALAHSVFNFIILLTTLAWMESLHWNILLFPLLVTPLILLALGVSWFLAAWGVFIKDLSQVVPIFVQMLLFLSPVLYPISAVPEILQPVYQYNPLGAVIESVRQAIIGQPVNWLAWIIALAFCLAMTILGHAFFRHSKDEFADAI